MLETDSASRAEITKLEFMVGIFPCLIKSVTLYPTFSISRVKVERKISNSSAANCTGWDAHKKIYSGRPLS
jgi:hypothetical protein